VSRHALWRWTAAHEIEIYRWLAEQTLDVRIPALIDADPDEGVLVLERLEGPPLARGRAARHVDPVEIARLSAGIQGLAALVPPLVAVPPDEVIAAMRERILPDPSDPGWLAAGARRLVSLGFLDEEDVPRGTECAFAHGDLFARNVLAGPALVDWELAGLHPAGWDLALLWTSLPAPGRAVLGPGDEALRQFALARERWVHKRARPA
jgi:hypothetical protein